MKLNKKSNKQIGSGVKESKSASSLLELAAEQWLNIVFTHLQVKKLYGKK